MRFMNRVARAAAALLACCTGSAWSQADEPTTSPTAAVPGFPATAPSEPRWRIAFSPYTLHFAYDSKHKPVVLLGAERESPNGVVWGGAVFSNSFGQPSAYLFGGQRLYHWSRWEPLYAEWTAGLIYGYTGEYQHKVPLNYKGFSPGLVAGVGWQFTQTLAGQVSLLGTSGLMFHVSVDLP
jgi:hypothetical protein